MKRRLLMSLAKAAACGLFVVTTLAQAATTVTTTAIQTITGAKTFSGSCKALLAGSTSGTTCLNAPAIAGSTTQIVFPAAAGTLATLAGTETFTNKSIAYGQLTGLGTGVSTWLGTPTGANLVSALSSGGGTATFLRADGAFATAGSTTSASDLSSGTLNCARTPALTGDVTTSAGSCATAIASSAVTTTTINANAVTNAKAAQMAAHTHKGNNTGSTADPLDLTATQLTAELNAVVGDSGSGGTKGLVPAPGIGAAAANKFLSAAGDFAAIPGVAGASLSLLEQHTASNSTTLDFTTCISSTYDEYRFELINVMPATNATALWMRMGTGAGPTIDTGANYSWESTVITGAASAITGTSGATKIQFHYTTHQSNSASWGIVGHFNLYSPGSASMFKQIHGQMHSSSSDPLRARWDFAGAYESATAVTGVQFLMSSGNITSGTIRCYGIAKS